MMSLFMRTLAGATLAATLLGGAASADPGSICSQGEDYTGTRKFEDVKWWVVSQCWSEDERRQFWFTSQGSRMLPYDWFLHLERADRQELFRGPASIGRFGYVPVAADPKWNPDGLPVGLAGSSKNDKDGTRWVGPTCAFCHSNLMVYENKPLFIDGAPTLGDFEGFNLALVDAMVATHGDDAKFARFAKAVLGPDAADPTKVADLRARFEVEMQRLATRNEMNQTAHRYGNGRVDAVGAIFNQVASVDIKAPENQGPSDAPVSFPFLWGTPQSSVVQWTGFAPNDMRGFGALVRNVGEVLGVYGVVEITNQTREEFTNSDYDWAKVERGAWWTGYKSSVELENLGTLEKLLHDLRSPAWPEDLLPVIDQTRAGRGGNIYQGVNAGHYGAESYRVEAVKCATCHAVMARADEAQTYVPAMVQISIIGTDPVVADNFSLARNPKNYGAWSSGLLKGTKSAVLFGERYGETLAQRASALVTADLGVILGHPFQGIRAALESYYDKTTKQTFDPRSYKARPLTGIWATAPYLHNGSVPNLYKLLLPQEQRSQAFYVGNRTFDPELVGFSAAFKAGTFQFKTSARGSSNAGHSGPMYGTDLTEDQRRDLLEYLKTL